MMKTYKFFAIVVVILTTSCATWRKTITPIGGLESIVNNVITDFENTSKLFNRDTVFSIIITDMDGYYIIGVGGAVNKIYPRSTEIIGTYDELLPNKCIIRGSKLFYWTDPNEKVSAEVIDILSLYNHIDFKWREEHYDLPPLKIDDGKEAVVYYICKNNIIKYKKASASTLMKHYKTPQFICK